MEHFVHTEQDDRSAYIRLGIRFLGFFMLWLILTEGYPGAWSFGLPVVIIALLVSGKIHRSGTWQWRWKGLCSFLPFFLWQSLRGGIDVARRAIDPQLPLAPGFLEHRLRLPLGPSRIFLADIISLLPGTCSVSMEKEDVLLVHVLDETMPTEVSLYRLEKLIAELFGLELNNHNQGGLE